MATQGPSMCTKGVEHKCFCITLTVELGCIDQEQNLPPHARQQKAVTIRAPQHV